MTTMLGNTDMGCLHLYRGLAVRLALTSRVYTYTHVCVLAWEGCKHTVDGGGLWKDQRMESTVAPEQGPETIRGY